MADEGDWTQFAFDDDDDDDDNHNEPLENSLDMEQEQNQVEISLHMTFDDDDDDDNDDDNTNHNTLVDTIQSTIDDEETQSDINIHNQLQDTIPISPNHSDIQSDASLEDLQTQNSDLSDQNMDEQTTNNNTNNQSTFPPLILNTTSVIIEQTNAESAVGLLSDTMNIDKHINDMQNNIENKNNNESNEMQSPVNDSPISQRSAVKHGRKRTVEERDDEEEKEIDLGPPAKRMRHDHDHDVEVPKTLRRSKRFERNEEIVLLRTGVSNKKKINEENKKLEEMGAVILDKYEERVSHIIINQPITTLKFMCGLANAKYIVNEIWPTLCVKKGNFAIDERRYFPNKGIKLFEDKYGCVLKELFKKRGKRNNLLFEGYEIYFMSDCDENMTLGIEQMAQAHGAECVNRLPRKYDEELIVIGDNINSKHCKNAKKKGYIVWSKDFIITSILRQNIETNDNELELK